MTRYGYILLLLFMPFTGFTQAFAPSPDWRFENFNSQNHFISREVLSLTVDKHGYVWGCSGGVQRFDGYKTIEFSSLDQGSGGLRANYTDVITDNNGRVWVSSGGLCYYDDASGKFIYPKIDKKHSNIAFTQGFCLQKNYLWFVCDYGLAKIDTRTLKVSFTSLTTVTDPLCTHLLNDNTLLVSSREKVYIYNIKNDTYFYSTFFYNNALVKINAVTGSDNTIFLGTNAGLFTLKKDFKSIERISSFPKDITVEDLLFLPQDKEKRSLFLATDGKGLMIYNTLLKKINFTYLHDDNNPFSLSNNITNKLFADKTGRLWIGTALGVCMLDVNNQQWKTRFLNRSNTDELIINRIAQDKYDSSKVWMSSYTQGMIRMDWNTKKIEKKFNTNPEIKKIYDFVQISKNKWLLVSQKKVMEWSPGAGITYSQKLPVADSIGFVYYIRRIIMADVNTCFITTNRGLFKYDLINHKINVAAESKLSKKTEDRQYDLVNGFYDNGIFWAASRNGLFKYNTATKETNIYRGPGSIPDYYFFDINNAGNNGIICTTGNGLAIFNKQTKRFTIVNTLANLSKPTCESVISVHNKVWISSEAGILNYDLDTHRSVKAEHETPLMQIFPGSPFNIIGNDIVVGFRNGYAYFTPEQKNTLVPSDPVIEQVYVNNQPVFEQNVQKLVLNYLHNSINIVFTAFLYTDPTHVNFRYRLNGADPNWQYPDDQRSANYAQLSPGNYTFYVQSGNKNGVWNNNPVSFNFIITPPYWATWWFRTFIILLIALVLYLIYKYRIKHLLAIERIRERIASDFHDDIGSALSSISIFSEVADKQLQRQESPEKTREIIGHISAQSRAMLDAMDDIIWTVNPQNDHFNDLAVRMREFAIPLLEARNINFDIDIQGDILNTRLKMDTRKNIFLVFKECINNILKHADCTAMRVEVNKLNNQLELIISDNGKGFDTDASHTRNGLKNMQKRAAEINSTIEVISRQGGGAVIKLTVNII